MDKKYKVSEFSELVGLAQKTIYRMIERGELMTVNDTQNGRKIVLIVANDKVIEQIKKNNENLTVNDCQYEETLSVNDMSKTQNANIVNEIADKILELTNSYNDRLMTVTDQLITYKSRVPLLEDKANREGLYLSEIKDLKKTNRHVIYWLMTVIVIFTAITVIMGFLLVIEHNKPPKVITTEKVIEKIVEKPVYRYINKK